MIIQKKMGFLFVICAIVSMSLYIGAMNDQRPNLDIPRQLPPAAKAPGSTIDASPASTLTPNSAVRMGQQDLTTITRIAAIHEGYIKEIGQAVDVLANNSEDCCEYPFNRCCKECCEEQGECCKKCWKGCFCMKGGQSCHQSCNECCDICGGILCWMACWCSPSE